MSSKVIQGFFWVAFAAFLSASIPHIAYFFRAFEPQEQGQDVLWWVVSFALAISIDVTIFLLSFTIAGLQRQGKSKGLVISVWVFIVGLAGLSWFINWEYAQQFSSTMLAHVSGIHLGATVSVGDINPIIASAFQALAIAYTWIADKIATDTPIKTAVQLKADADELEALAHEQERIRAIKLTGKVSVFTGMIDSAKTVAKHARNATHNATQNDTGTQHRNEQERNDITELNATQNATSGTDETQHRNEQEHSSIPASITEQDATVKRQETQHKTQGINEQDATINTASHGVTSPKSVTIKDASLLLNLTESYVRTLVHKGKLRTSPRNNKMVLMSSIKSYQNIREEEGINETTTERITGALPVLKLVVNDEERVS